jgi:hypothetical protein
MSASTFTSDDDHGVEARARVLDIMAAANSAGHPFDDFDVERTYERKGHRCATTFADPRADNYGDTRTRITITLELDENQNPELLQLVNELSEAELAEERAKALQERDAAQTAAAAAKLASTH